MGLVSWKSIITIDDIMEKRKKELKDLLYYKPKEKPKTLLFTKSQKPINNNERIPLTKETKFT